MCSCIEEVSKVCSSNCTQIDVAQTFLLNLDSNGFLGVAKEDDNFEIKFNACQEINDDGEAQNNDLAAYSANEGRITEETQDEISQTLIGGNNGACDQ